MLYAEFIGYQDDGMGGKFPLYDIIDPTGKHPQHQSTVGARTLDELGIKIIFYGSRMGRL